MNQITLLIIELILCLLMIIVLYKKYKNKGLYAYSSIAIILTSIMSLKTITLYDYDMNLGIIPFVTIFTCSNILVQKKGTDEAKTLLLTTISSYLIGFLILFLISFISFSNIDNVIAFGSASYDNIFRSSFRMYFATIVTTLYSLLLNLKLYYYLKRIKNNIAISNIFTSIIVHFISSILFGVITNIFVSGINVIDIVKIVMIRYLISIFVSIISTVVMYTTVAIKE